MCARGRKNSGSDSLRDQTPEIDPQPLSPRLWDPGPPTERPAPEPSTQSAGPIGPACRRRAGMFSRSAEQPLDPGGRAPAPPGPNKTSIYRARRGELEARGVKRGVRLALCAPAKAPRRNALNAMTCGAKSTRRNPTHPSAVLRTMLRRVRRTASWTRVAVESKGQTKTALERPHACLS